MGLSHSSKWIDHGIGLMARFLQDSLKIWNLGFLVQASSHPKSMQVDDPMGEKGMEGQKYR